MLLLQEFDFTIIHTLGRLHAIADYLSQIDQGEEVVGVSDQLPHAGIFVVQTFKEDNWHDQMLNFLLDGMLPAQMTVDQKRKFCIEKQTFSDYSRKSLPEGYRSDYKEMCL